MGRNRRPVKPPRTEAAADRRFVSALARGLDVLSCFSSGERWLANQEIARRTGLPKATVSRLTFTLTSMGYLDHSRELEKYALGLPVLGLGFRTLSHFEIGAIARPFMQQVADEAGAAVSMGVRHGCWVVYVAHCRSTAPLTLGLDIGARLPISTSAIGRAILATLDPGVRAAVLREAAAEQIPVATEEIEEALDDYRTHGFTMSPPGGQIGAVAVPFRVNDGREHFGLNCGGPAELFTQQRLRGELGQRMRKMVRDIEHAIHSGP